MIVVETRKFDWTSVDSVISPLGFYFLFLPVLVSRMGESSEESCCPRADELLMPDHCLGHVPIRKNSRRYDILNSV